MDKTFYLLMKCCFWPVFLAQKNGQAQTASVFRVYQALAPNRTRRTGLNWRYQRQGTCKTSRSCHASSQRTC